MTIDLTPAEAQALADLMDREVRLHGIQTAALYGPVLRQMIEKAKTDGPSGDE